MIGLLPTASYHLPNFTHCVERVNFYDGSLNPAIGKEGVFHLHPDGVFEIIFQLGTPVWQRAPGEEWQIREDAFIGGLFKGHYELKIVPATRLISIRCKAGMAKYLIPEKLDQFTNQLVPYQDLWKNQLAEQLSATNDHQRQLQLIAASLRKWLRPQRRTVIDTSVQHLLQHNGTTDLPTLAQNASLSTAQFRKRFCEEVGLSPKYFARIVRINAITAKLRTSTCEPLTELGYRYGYFDQAHFIRDFQKVTGFTPGKYRLLTRS
ncbi:MAG: helix-turn-helix transcriptional regulator [Bacteroidota bacterium]